MTTLAGPVPSEVLTAYGLPADALVQPLGDGVTNSINRNFTAAHEDRKVVLQCMSPIFGREATADNKAVTDYLRGRGWVVPEILPAADGTITAPDAEGNDWRATGHIDWDGKVPEYDDQLMADVGSLLAQLHVDLAEFDYEPLFRLPNFHDTPFYMGRLATVRDKIPDARTREVAGDILERYQASPNLPEGEEQLIHGDPRADNYLYWDGQPVPVIDWDTVMRGSPWIDIGDFLRSAGEEARSKSSRALGSTAVAAFCEAYRAVAQPDADPKEFMQNALDAARLIALELAARFATDVAENSYFTPPPGQDRRTFVAGRAALQWEIYQDLTKIKEAV